MYRRSDGVELGITYKKIELLLTAGIELISFVVVQESDVQSFLSVYLTCGTLLSLYFVINLLS